VDGAAELISSHSMESLRRGPRAWRARPEMLVLAALSFCAAVYIGPLITLATYALRERGEFTLAHITRLLHEESYHEAFLVTFKTAAISTIACVLLGYPVAYLMATTGKRASAMLAAAVMIPFWTSVLARSLAWVIILGRRGIVNGWLLGIGLTDEPLRLIFNSFGVQVGMVHVLLPFMILPIWSVLARLDPALITAARSLGAGPIAAFVHVVLPLSLPGLAAGITLVFMLAIGFYVTPALLGGPQDITVVTLIEMAVRDLLDWPLGSVLSLALLSLVACAFGLGAMIAGVDRLTGGEGRK
jgi:putative spermidine/putrescine transport system permease protein